MNTGLAQIVALAAHGNWALSGADRPRQVNLADNTVLRFVGELAFTVEPGDVVARDPNQWFEYLHRLGASRVSMSRRDRDGRNLLPTHHAVAFAGGEQAGILSPLPSGSSLLWVPGWELVDRNAPDRKIWGVEYRGFPIQATERTSPSVGEASTTLHQVLTDIATFAAQQGLGNWVPIFKSADATLGGSPIPDTLGLLPDSGYPDSARRLLGAAMSSWVFGGMGSWNDTGPRDSDQQGRYDELSASLYDAIMDALVAVANGFEG